MKKHFWPVLISLLLVSVSLLGACTKATPTVTTTTQPATTTPATTVKPAATTATTVKPVATTTVTPTTTAVNKKGGTLRIIWNDTAPLMGYPVTSTAPGQFYAGFAVETLVEISDKPQIYFPLLATSWDLAPDKSSYTFRLRKGVKFSDGTDFNAAAVKWNIDNMITAKRVEVASVSSVDIVDDNTVRMNISKWNALILDTFSRGALQIISPTAFQKNGKEWAQVNPTGTGPFLLKEYEQSLYTKYVRNPNYWDPGIPYLDKIEVYTVKDPMTRQAMLLNGDAEGARELDQTSAKGLVDSGKYVVELGGAGNFQLWFNSVDPASAWSKPQMRMALEYAVDKQTLSDALGKGFASPSYEVINGIWEVKNNNPGTTPRKYDPAKAVQLIKEAGYPNGLKTSVELNTKFNDEFVTAIQAQLAKVGITIEINPVSQAAWQPLALQPTVPNVLRYNRGRGGSFDILRVPSEDLASASLQYPGVKRPEGWDTLLNQAMQEVDPAKMLSIANQMEQKAYNEAMFVPIYLQKNINVWSPKLKNDRGTILYWGGGDPSIHLRYTYLTK